MATTNPSNYQQKQEEKKLETKQVCAHIHTIQQLIIDKFDRLFWAVLPISKCNGTDLILYLACLNGSQSTELHDQKWLPSSKGRVTVSSSEDP